jgi:hypothetical protein
MVPEWETEMMNKKDWIEFGLGVSRKNPTEFYRPMLKIN